MARIPGIEVERDVRDAAGRHGIALAMPDDTRSFERREIIMDPDSYAYLGNRAVASQDFRSADGWKAGELMWSEAIVSMAVVDRPGQTP